MVLKGGTQLATQISTCTQLHSCAPLAQQFEAFLGIPQERCDSETRRWLFWLWMMELDRLQDLHMDVKGGDNNV